MTGMEAAAEVVRRALNRTEGVCSSVGLDKEMEAIVAKLPDNMNSSEEFAKKMKVLGKVSVKDVNVGKYKEKVINYTEE